MSSIEAPLATAWKTKPLGELFEVVGGGTPSKKEPSYYGGNIPWATIRDMHSATLTKTEHTITDQGLQASSAKLIPAGEVIMASRVGLGKACLLHQDTAINQDIRALIPRNTDAIDRRFCLYWLQTQVDAIIDAGSGATVQGIKLPFIKSLPFPGIPMEKQKRVVAVLDKAFAALGRASTNAEANLADAKNLFSAKLRRIFQHEAKDWEKHLLPQLCTHFGRGKSRHRPRNDPSLYGGEFPFIQTGDISEADHFLRDYRQTYSQAGLDQSKLWPQGTICIAIVGATIGETAILSFDACFPDSVIGLRPDPERLDPEFTEYMLQAFKEDLKQAGKGSARDNINLRTFEMQRFPVPDLAMQQRVVNDLSDARLAADQLTALYSEKVSDLDALRQSLLQAAFTGRLA